VYKIAIVGASSLLGKEMNDALAESSLAVADVALLEEDEGLGQLDQLGDEITFVQAISPDSFEHVDFTFFCGADGLTQKYWREALRAGSTVLDLSGALYAEPGVLVRSPWIGAQEVAADLFTPAVVPAHPAALALALLMERVQQVAPVRQAAATVLLPASEFGRAAMDELHQQTVNLLSFQSLPKATFDAQSAYNLLSGFGENSKANIGQLDGRIKRQYNALGGRRLPALAIQTISAPVFHGHCFSVFVELERPVDVTTVEEALSGEHVDLVLEETDSPSNLAATGQNDVLVRLRMEPGARNANESSRLWLWGASDNLRLHAQNAVECALDLRRLRPQGTVQ